MTPNLTPSLEWIENLLGSVLKAIRDFTSIVNMLAVFGILLYFRHSSSNIKARLVLFLYKHAYATTKYSK